MAEMAEWSTIRANALLPSGSLSPFMSTGLTRYCRNKHANTATNSTWENLRPTHSRGPPAHGMNVPGAGSRKVSSCCCCGGWDGWMLLLLLVLVSQRLGRQSRASGPQVWGSVWRAVTLMLMPVFGGRMCVFAPRASVWAWKAVDFGMKIMELYRRKVSCWFSVQLADTWFELDRWKRSGPYHDSEASFQLGETFIVLPIFRITGFVQDVVNFFYEPILAFRVCS